MGPVRRGVPPARDEAALRPPGCPALGEFAPRLVYSLLQEHIASPGVFRGAAPERGDLGVNASVGWLRWGHEPSLRVEFGASQAIPGE